MEAPFQDISELVITADTPMVFGTIMEKEKIQ
jgi:hypothetical protein